MSVANLTIAYGNVSSTNVAAIATQTNGKFFEMSWVLDIFLLQVMKYTIREQYKIVVISARMITADKVNCISFIKLFSPPIVSRFCIDVFVVVKSLFFSKSWRKIGVLKVWFFISDTDLFCSNVSVNASNICNIALIAIAVIHKNYGNK